MKSNYIAESVLVACSLLIVVLVGAGAINLKESQRGFVQEVKSLNNNIAYTKTVLSQVKDSCKEDKIEIISSCGKVVCDFAAIDDLITTKAVIWERIKQTAADYVCVGSLKAVFAGIKSTVGSALNFASTCFHKNKDQQLKKEIKNG